MNLRVAVKRARKRWALREIDAVRERAAGGDLGTPEARDAFLLRDAGRYTPAVAVDSELGRMLVSPYDRGKGRAVFVSRRVETGALDLAVRLAAEHGPRPPAGGVFVDVGAHIGTTTVSALRRHGFARTLSAEPEPANFELLRANVLLAAADGQRSELANVAVSDREGTVELLINPGMHGKHSVSEDAAVPGARRVPVRAVTLDGLLAEHAVNPAEVGLVKIDVEGHEPAVLRGASGLLGAGVALTLEYAPDRWDEVAAVEAALASAFTFFVELRGDQRLRPVSDLAAVRGARITDLLLLP